MKIFIFEDMNSRWGYCFTDGFCIAQDKEHAKEIMLTKYKKEISKIDDKKIIQMDIEMDNSHLFERHI